MILVNRTNARPAKADDLKVGDLYILVRDLEKSKDGAVHGYKVIRRWASRTPGRMMLQDNVYLTRGIQKDMDILIWTGGPTLRSDWAYPADRSEETSSGCETLDNILKF